MSFERGFIKRAAGSCLAALGSTRVLCTVSVEARLPPWMPSGRGGWLTAEYGMLPASTDTRKPRESRTGRLDGRSAEIQRLIGRALRASVDLGLLGDRTVTVDCDVIEADGGTRVTAINGACLALWDALDTLAERGELSASPFIGPVCAVSVGVVGGRVLTDLCYEEDRRADSDMNIVLDASGRFIEVQATAERAPIGREHLDLALEQAETAIASIRSALAAAREGSPAR